MLSLYLTVYRLGSRTLTFEHNNSTISYPIFIAKDKKRVTTYKYGQFLLTSKHPIKMPLKFILCLNNLPIVPEIEFDSCPPNIHLVKVENGNAYTDGETVGHLSGSVIIGKCESSYYWIPNHESIEKRFYCTKLPGICDVFFRQKQQLQKHLPICSDETKIVSHQVRFLLSLFG